MMKKTFLGLPNNKKNYDKSKFVVIPCPYEKTTSYEKGTKEGPKAIIKASNYLESFDEELLMETVKIFGIHTVKSISLNKLYSCVLEVLKSKKIPITLGGEHSLSYEAVKAAKKKFPNLSVLHFDAHADMRFSYEGARDSHACVMRKILEICPVFQIGIRSISAEEWEFVKRRKQISKMNFHAKSFKKSNQPSIDKIISSLSENVYITFDVDVLDPSIMPSTGTPEPHGLLWAEVLDIFYKVSKNKRVIGSDFVELMPIKFIHPPDFTIAKLIYKLMGYIGFFGEK